MTTPDPQLSVELSRLAARRWSPAPGEAPGTTEQLLAAITSFQNLVSASTELQGQAVRAAHEAGVSWAKIGELLGTSRQAVQQRFDPHYVPAEAAADRTRILGPVTRAEELDHLSEAGAHGWRLVSARHGEHLLERDDREWEVKRVSVFSARPMPSERDGWHAAAIRFPDCFFVRPAGDSDTRTQ